MDALPFTARIGEIAASMYRETVYGPADAVPWFRGTRIRVRVPRSARGLARALGTQVELRQADARSRELGEGDLAG